MFGTRRRSADASRTRTSGARAIEQLRLVAVEFETAPLRHAVHILPDVVVPALRARAPFDPTRLDSREPRLKTLGDDLVWGAAALAAARRGS